MSQAETLQLILEQMAKLLAALNRIAEAIEKEIELSQGDDD